MVECDLAKVEVAGSNPVSRSNISHNLREPAGDVAASKRTQGGASVPPLFFLGAVAKW